MPQEIVVTSVPRGLDGGSGLQIVKRTRGIPLAVAQRMQQESGYTHHFLAGDKRNPVVVSCRIERLRNGVFHVLSLIKDAGADHSGRQNSLAHLIAFDETDIFEKQAGPAPVAKKLRDARLFLNSWNQQPHESDAPVVISPRAEPGVCAAWRDAGFDPGLAGEIAASAVAGKRAVVIVPPEADVVSLFADAMLLMPPEARWKTTFTTSGSGNADYVWQAVRTDLPQAETARRLPGVIDLTKSPSAADGPYVDFARSGKGMLPWQRPATSDEGSSVAPVLPTVETDGSSQNLDVSEVVSPVFVPPVSEAVPPGVTHAGTGATSQLQPANLNKRQLGQGKIRPPKVPTKGQSTFAPLSLPFVSAVCVIVASLVLVLIFGKPIITNALMSSGNENRDTGNQTSNRETPNLNQSISEVAVETREHEKNEIRKSQDDAKTMEERRQVQEDKEEERKRIDAERMAEKKKREDAAAAAKRQRLACRKFNALPPFISLPAGAQLGVDELKTKPVLIGTLSVDDLIDFELKIAVPSGARMEVRKIEDGSNLSWLIESLADDSDGKAGTKALARMWCRQGDNENEPGEFLIEPCSPDVFREAEYKHLLRSAILLSAILPGEGGSEPVVKQLNLIKPIQGQEIRLTPGNNRGEKKQCSLGVSQTLWGSSSSTNPLKIEDLKIKLRVVSPCNVLGDLEKTVVELNEKVRINKKNSQPEVLSYEVPILKSHGRELPLKITVCPARNRNKVAAAFNDLQFPEGTNPMLEATLKNNFNEFKKDEKDFDSFLEREISRAEKEFSKLKDINQYIDQSKKGNWSQAMTLKLNKLVARDILEKFSEDLPDWEGVKKDREPKPREKFQHWLARLERSAREVSAPQSYQPTNAEGAIFGPRIYYTIAEKREIVRDRVRNVFERNFCNRLDQLCNQTCRAYRIQLSKEYERLRPLFAMRLRSWWKKYTRKPRTTARSMKFFWLTKMRSPRQVSQGVRRPQVWINQINLRSELVYSLHNSKTYQGILATHDDERSTTAADDRTREKKAQ